MLNTVPAAWLRGGRSHCERGLLMPVELTALARVEAVLQERITKTFLRRYDGHTRISSKTLDRRPCQTIWQVSIRRNPKPLRISFRRPQQESAESDQVSYNANAAIASDIAHLSTSPWVKKSCPNSTKFLSTSVVSKLLANY